MCVAHRHAYEVNGNVFQVSQLSHPAFHVQQAMRLLLRLMKRLHSRLWRKESWFVLCLEFCQRPVHSLKLLAHAQLASSGQIHD